jgi:hypothetical protein
MIIPGGDDLIRDGAAMVWDNLQRDRSARYGVKPIYFAAISPKEQAEWMRPFREFAAWVVLATITDAKHALGPQVEGLAGAMIVAALEKYLKQELGHKEGNGHDRTADNHRSKDH